MASDDDIQKELEASNLARLQRSTEDARKHGEELSELRKLVSGHDRDLSSYLDELTLVEVELNKFSQKYDDDHEECTRLRNEYKKWSQRVPEKAKALEQAEEKLKEKEKELKPCAAGEGSHSDFAGAQVDEEFFDLMQDVLQKRCDLTLEATIERLELKNIINNSSLKIHESLAVYPVASRQWQRALEYFIHTECGGSALKAFTAEHFPIHKVLSEGFGADDRIVRVQDGTKTLSHKAFNGAGFVYHLNQELARKENWEGLAFCGVPYRFEDLFTRFQVGKQIVWYEPKNLSDDRDQAATFARKNQFGKLRSKEEGVGRCGTLFELRCIEGCKVGTNSFFPDQHKVLVPALSKFVVVQTERRSILGEKCAPDKVVLRQRSNDASLESASTSAVSGR